MTPAQRYVAACTTLKNLAGVDVQEIQSDIVGDDCSGVVSIEGLERLADVCTLLSRARAENLAPGVTTYSCLSRPEECADLECPEHSERTIQTRVPSKVIPVKSTTITKGNR